jgi:hypothetical protein
LGVADPHERSTLLDRTAVEAVHEQELEDVRDGLGLEDDFVPPGLDVFGALAVTCLARGSLTDETTVDVTDRDRRVPPAPVGRGRPGDAVE